jgi:hypothetical protein
MLRITALRLLCQVLAVVTIFVFWYVVDTKFVNDIFQDAEDVAKAAARIIASFTNTSPILAETIVADKMHLDSTLVIGTLMTLWMFVILFVQRSGNTWWHVKRVILAILVVHAVLLVAWFGWTAETATWYKGHAEFVKATLRVFGAYKTETLVVKVLQLHSVLVFLEVVILYSLLLATIERASERRHAAWTSLGR